MKRIKNIDIAKGICLLFVVYTHTTANYYLKLIGLGFYISFFFIISGFMQTKEPNWQYGIAKIKKLLYPYLTINIFLLGILYIINPDISLNYYIGMLYSRYSLYIIGHEPNIIFFSMISNATLWFLTAMSVSYILFIFLLKKGPSLALLYFIIAVMFTNFKILLPWSIDTAFYFSILIYIGYLARNKISTLSAPPPLLFVIILIFYLLFSYWNEGSNLSVRNYGQSIILHFICSLTGSWLLLHFSSFIEKFSISSLLAEIGRNSLGIFCLHLPILYECNLIINKICPFFQNSIWLGICNTLITIFLTLWLSIIISKKFNFLFSYKKQ